MVLGFSRDIDNASPVTVKEAPDGSVAALSPPHPDPGIIDPAVAIAEVLGVRAREQACYNIRQPAQTCV